MRISKTFIMFIECSYAYVSENTRNTDDFLCSGTKLLLPSLSLGFSPRGERGTHNFSMLTVRPSSAFDSLTQPTNARTPQSTNSLASPRSEKSTRFVLLQISTHCFYSKSLRIPAHRFRAWRHSHPQSLFPIWGFYCHILPARAWTPALISAPTHALSRKVLSLTKPKDKLYKTKNDNIKKILPQLFNRIFFFSQNDDRFTAFTNCATMTEKKRFDSLWFPVQPKTISWHIYRQTEWQRERETGRNTRIIK